MASAPTGNPTRKSFTPIAPSFACAIPSMGSDGGRYGGFTMLSRESCGDTHAPTNHPCLRPAEQPRALASNRPWHPTTIQRGQARVLLAVWIAGVIDEIRLGSCWEHRDRDSGGHSSVRPVLGNHTSYTASWIRQVGATTKQAALIARLCRNIDALPAQRFWTKLPLLGCESKSAPRLP